MYIHTMRYLNTSFHLPYIHFYSDRRRILQCCYTRRRDHSCLFQSLHIHQRLQIRKEGVKGQYHQFVLLLVLCLDVAGRLVSPYRDPRSYTGGSLGLLAGSTMPGWSAGEGSDKTSTGLVLQVGG